MKFVNNTFIDISFTQLKNVFINNSKIKGFSSIFRNEVFNLLENSKLNKLSKQDFFDLTKKIDGYKDWLILISKIIDNPKIELLKRLIAIFGTIENLKNNIDEYNLKVLLKRKQENLLLVLGLCENFDQLILLSETSVVVSTIEYAKNDRLHFFMGLCYDVYDFIKGCKTGQLRKILIGLGDKEFNKIVELLKVDSLSELYDIIYNSKFEKLLLTLPYLDLQAEEIRVFFKQDTYLSYTKLKISLYEALFNVPADESSIFLKKILKKMKADVNLSLNDILCGYVSDCFIKLTNGFTVYNDEQRKKNGKSINQIQDLFIESSDKEIIEKLGLDTDNHELSIYVRYGNTVDYPEFAEAIILFAKMYIAKGLSKYFSSIRIIPRKEGLTIKSNLFDTNTKFYNVQGDEFIVALHTYASVVMLSHSTNSNPYSIPNIISSGCKKKLGDIRSRIELERDYIISDKKAFNLSEAELDEVLKEFLNNLQALEKRLDIIRFSKIKILKGLCHDVIKKFMKNR